MIENLPEADAILDLEVGANDLFELLTSWWKLGDTNRKSGDNTATWRCT